MLWPLFTPGKDPVPIVQEAENKVILSKMQVSITKSVSLHWSPFLCVRFIRSLKSEPFKGHRTYKKLHLSPLYFELEYFGYCSNS